MRKARPVGQTLRKQAMYDVRSEDAVAHEEVLGPVAALTEHGCGDAHSALARAGVDHLAVAEIDADVALGHGRAGEYEDVAALEIVHIGDLFVLGAASPCDRGHVALLNARLIQAPVHKTGAVERVRSLCTAHILAAELRFRDIDQPFDAGLVGAAAAGGRAAGGAAAAGG